MAKGRLWNDVTIWTDWPNRLDRTSCQNSVLYVGMKEMWNGDKMLVVKPEVKNCTHIQEYNWHFEARYWCRYYKHRGCSVSLLLGPATWCCLKQHCLCNVLLETNMAQSNIYKSKCSELRPAVITCFHTISTLASGSYESEWEQVTI
jgi:hypothetical protein